MWSALISIKLNLYRIAAGSCRYKSSDPCSSKHHRLSGASTVNTSNPERDKSSQPHSRPSSNFHHQSKTDGRTRMRRTRYVALPVRAWQYVGLLVVSLACLTLGLVSRDKEGRAGSLAGPELKHQAPHEVDACPNLNPFIEIPSCLNRLQDRAKISRATRETRDSISALAPVNRRLSRSRSVERVSKIGLQSRSDFRSMQRLDELERNGRNNLSRRDLRSNLRTRNEIRTRRSSDSTIQLSQSLRSRSMEDFARLKRTDRGSIDSDRRRETNRKASESRERENDTRTTERGTSTDRLRERNVDRRNQIRATIVRDSRLVKDRRSLSRTNRREITDEQRGRIDLLDRQMNARSNERQKSLDRSSKRSTNNALEPRERTHRSRIAREKPEARIVRELENSADRLKVKRVYLSGDRRLERRSLVDYRRVSETRSESVKSQKRDEFRTERSLMEQRITEPRADRRLMERRTDRRLVEERMNERLKEQRTARSTMAPAADRRRMEERSILRLPAERVDQRIRDQKTSRRSMEQRSDRAVVEQRAGRRIMEHRSDRTTLEQRAGRRIMEQKSDRTVMEQKGGRRIMEQRSDRTRIVQRAERRLMSRTDIESDRLMEHRTDRRLMDQRAARRPMEQRIRSRLVESRIDREDFGTRRLLQQRLDANRLQRSRRTIAVLSASDIRLNEKEQRLKDRARLLQVTSRDRTLSNDARRSRSVNRELYQSTNRDSRSRSTQRDLEDSAIIRENIKLSRFPDQYRNFRISSSSGDFMLRRTTLTAANFLKEENTVKQGLKFDVIRQALVIGLCTMYGLSMFHGKRSFITNFMSQAPRFNVW